MAAKDSHITLSCMYVLSCLYFCLVSCNAYACIVVMLVLCHASIVVMFSLVSFVMSMCPSLLTTSCHMIRGLQHGGASRRLYAIITRIMIRIQP